MPGKIKRDQKGLTALQKAQAALEAACGAKPIDQIAREYGAEPAQVRRWEQELIQNSASLFRDDGMQSRRTEATRHHLLPDQPSALPHAGLDAGSSQLTLWQVQVNEALVIQILALQRAEETLLQSENRLRQLIAHRDQIKEKERKRIARDIHDDLGQNLLVLRMDAVVLLARTDQENPHLHELVNIMVDNIDATIKSVRSIINDLRPFELELGLQAAVDWQLKEFGRITGVTCQLSVDESTFGDALDDVQTLAIFRILQESLSNIARHSGATKVEVKLSRTKCEFLMTVSDNGIGTQTNGEGKSFGIVGMKERVSSLGGEFTFNSMGGKGTVVSVVIPVET
jgi:signal transduction histidine kinase